MSTKQKHMPEVLIEYKNKKSSSATVKDGKILLRISNRLPKSIQQEHITSLTNRLSRKLIQQSAKQKYPQPKDIHQNVLKTGDCIIPFGLLPFWLDITYQERNNVTIALNPNKPIITITAPHHSTNQTLKNKLATKVTNMLVPQLNKRIQQINQATVKHPFIKPVQIKNLKAKWGYCQAQNNLICLAQKLFWLPQEHVEYIIIHELCHFVHQNHSKAFWQEVEKYCPNYKQLDTELINWQ